MKTISDVKRRISSKRRWLNVLNDGLSGSAHSLGSGEGDAFEKFLKTLDLEAISVSRAAKRGLQLRRAAKPICSRYYKRPISSYHDLYLLQHFQPTMPEESSDA